MEKIKKLTLVLNKQVIDQLDAQQMNNIQGGNDLTMATGCTGCCSSNDTECSPCVSLPAETTPATCCACTY